MKPPNPEADGDDTKAADLPGAEHQPDRLKAWQLENRGAIEAWTRWIEEKGIPFAELRPW